MCNDPSTLYIGVGDFFVPTLPAFDSNTTNQMECFVVTANNDSDFESLEMFTVQLTLPQAPLSIDPARAITTFTIDGKVGNDYRYIECHNN